MKSKYNLRHVRCSMQDFQADRHRFHFTYEMRPYMAECFGGCNLVFHGDPPEEVREEVSKEIFDVIDKNEYKWKYPQEAYDIADAYVDFMNEDEKER